MGSWGRFFAVGVGIALLGVAASCANGSSYNGNGDDAGDDGSMLGDDQSSGSSSGGGHDGGGGIPDGGCTNGTEACDGSCVNTSTDPNNCGGCGKSCMGLLCSQGSCSVSCSSTDGGQETECPGGGDGGAAQPYCSNLQTDPANCGMCGKSCGPNHACQAGSCILSCPPSQTECVSGDTCIPVGACCTTNDCTIAGETCATPGSTCTCPGGQKACAANNQCIVSTTCCTSTDCAISGETCSGPGGTCTCPVGQTACAASGTCIPSTNCCTNADCTTTGETCATPGGTCACPTGFNACVANNACIPTTECCTSADCTVAGETCSAPGGTCGCTTGNKVCTVSNSCIPTNTCCTSNDCLATGETCTGPGGNCTCPNSGSVCTIASPPFDACIAQGQCCTNADCVGGGTCSGPGGSCNCPTGQTFCSTSNSCIPTSSCCPATGCPVTGETCSGAGGTCSCSVAGDTVCGNLCIPANTCCTAASCLPVPSGATATACPGPGDACTLTCNSTCFDLDKTFSDGCECCEDANLTCGGNATGQNLGTLVSPGNTATGTGTLPGSTPDWFQVSFAGPANLSAHPKVSVSGAGVVFDIYSSCAGGGSQPESCSAEGVGVNCTAKTTWETSYNCPTCMLADTPSAEGNGFMPINIGTVYIKVYRPTGTPASCAAAAFTLSVSY